MCTTYIESYGWNREKQAFQQKETTVFVHIKRIKKQMTRWDNKRERERERKGGGVGERLTHTLR